MLVLQSSCYSGLCNLGAHPLAPTFPSVPAATTLSEHIPVTLHENSFYKYKNFLFFYIFSDILMLPMN